MKTVSPKILLLKTRISPVLTWPGRTTSWLRPTGRLLLVVALWISQLPPIFSSAVAAAQVASDEAGELAAAKAEYEAAVAALRKEIKALKVAEIRFYYSDSETALDYRADWDTAAEKSTASMARLTEAASRYFLLNDQPNDDLKILAIAFSKRYFNEGRFERARALSEKISRLFPNEDGLQSDFARISMFTNGFETAANFAALKRSELSKLPTIEQNLFSQVNVLREKFKREQALRDAEAAANDLPRVELETNKGKIVIELFENEAPETVGNFVSLVEAGFYDGVIFHIVMPKLLAHTGAMTMDRIQDTGYTIYDEFQRDDARAHFRGSVCMAVPVGVVNGGTGQFYILRAPFSGFESRHTVFGRVLEGMDVVDRLNDTVTYDEEGVETPVEDVVPDKVVKATILRKRDHVYEPNIVKEPDVANEPAASAPK